ncbi:MAG: DMT family transporter [Lachnospiraceae bacterium]|nr:DMT family transporter [Lachnospiraceae bacterium]
MNQKTKGIFFIISAAFCFSLMSLFVRLSGDLPSFEKSFWRNLVAIAFAIYAIEKNHISYRLENPKNLKYLFIRAIGGTIGIFCNYYAIDHLVIADANMLNKLSPFFAILFSYFVLNEKIKPVQLGFVFTAFIGALCILKPSGNFSSFPAIIGMIGGMGAGLAYTYVRKATQNGVKGPQIVLFFSVFSCIASIPLMLPVFVVPSPTQILYLFLAGLAAAGGQFSITAAYTYAPAREISVYDYTQIIFAALLGMFLLGELPDYLSILGYFIICGAGIAMFYYNKRDDH